MNFTPTEIQILAFKFRSMEKLRAFLEMEPKEFRKVCYDNNIVDPPRYLRRKSIIELENELIEHRSIDAMADWYGVSASLINTILTEKGSPKRAPREQNWDEAYFVAELQRVGNVGLLAHLWDCKESLIRDFAKEAGIEINSLIRIGHSNSTSEIGRKAELCWKELRGDRILKDMNLEDSKSDHDFLDSELGMVDVKSSPYRPYKSVRRYGTGYHSFRLCNLTQGVKIVLAFMDSTGNSILDWCYLEHVPPVTGILIRSDSTLEYREDQFGNKELLSV